MSDAPGVEAWGGRGGSTETHPFCAGRGRPQLLLDLLPDLLHRHLGLLDGSLGRVEPGGKSRQDSSTGQTPLNDISHSTTGNKCPMFIPDKVQEA